MFKKIVFALGVLFSLSAQAKDLVYRDIYELPYWGGNPYTPMAISRVEQNKSNPSPLNAQYILGIQDREFFNKNSISKTIDMHSKPLHLFNNWFIQSERPRTACNGTQLVLRSSTGDLRGIVIKPEKPNWIDMVFDCYVAKKNDQITRVIYLTNDVVAFDSTVGLFFFNMSKGKFYNEVFKTPDGMRAVLYQTQDNDFLVEAIEPGTPIRKYRDNFDPRVGLRALRLDGERVPGVVKQEDLNTIPNKRGL